MREAYETVREKYVKHLQIFFLRHRRYLAGNLENECLMVIDNISLWRLIHVCSSKILAGIREFNDNVKSLKWLIYKSLSMTADG